MKQTKNPFLIALFSYFILSGIAYADFDDKGKLGGVLAFSAGSSIGYGTDTDGKSSSSFIGTAFQFHFGEEVWQGLHLGLSFDMAQGKTQDDKYNQSLFAFGPEIRWRLSDDYRGFYFIGGIGVGGGGLTTIKQKDKNDFPGGSSGGSIWKLGMGYVFPLYENQNRFLLSPKLLYQRMGEQFDSKATLDTFCLTIELLWGSGRKSVAEEAKAEKAIK